LTPDVVPSDATQVQGRQHVAYDPAGHVVQLTLRGHPRNDAAGAQLLLQRAQFVYDEAGRQVRTRQRLFIDDATQAQLARAGKTKVPEKRRFLGQPGGPLIPSGSPEDI
jgi:hypothetical protein